MSVLHLAMWSGPRNISTAMMRSWENRGDCAVVDEPLYAHYLEHTGLDHPGREAVIAAGETDWRRAANELIGPVPGNRAIYYQKHMTHHLLPGVDRSRLAGLRHAFLIRDPRRLLASYARVRDTPTLADLGLEQQLEIYRLFGGPVIDAADLAARPRPMLEGLCAALRIPFEEAMLAWPAGPRPTDGVWAKHWYARVWASTGFDAGRDERSAADPGRGAGAGAENAAVALPAGLEGLAARCQPFYDELATHRLRL